MDNSLLKSDYFFNRELSWIQFNKRVLEEAADRNNPLLERIKFLSIFSTNLDEFFMIRVSGLKRQIVSNVNELSSDGLNAQEQRDFIYGELCPMVKEQYRIYNEEILLELTANNIEFSKYRELSGEERESLEKYFDDEIYPVLTPIAIDSVHPFPNLVNRSIAFAMILDDPETEVHEEKISVLQIPGNIPRFKTIDNKSGLRFILLEDIIRANVHKLFPGMHMTECYALRITRNADLELEEEEADDLLTLIEEEVKKRRLGILVRIEVDEQMPENILNYLKEDLELNHTEIYKVNGPLNLGDFMYLFSSIDRKELKYEGYMPRISSFFLDEDDFFKAIRKRDIMLHHPFYSFSSVTEFIAQAAEDKSVLAIKLILYRTSGDSPIIKSLINAAEKGIQVTAVVELKARFDEENNIVWARKLEKAGVHVVYGISGLKTHSKLLLVVRRESGEIKRYLHLSTGNYNPITARIYTDLGLFTCSKDFINDASDLFNYLTGFSKKKGYRKFLVAPYTMRKSFIKFIENEIDSHEKNGNGRIIIKANSLVDDKVIMKLYQASQAGVKVDLIIRGICRLRPGIPELSKNIRVISIVGRFLEHSRVYLFHNNGNPVIYTGSADIMQRNFDRRVEILYPIEDPSIMKDLYELLELYLADTVKARELNSSGVYTYVKDFVTDEKLKDFNVQEYFVSKVKKKYKDELKKEYKKKINKLKQKKILH
ncbi:MAG: polyphosphate kinase 1 [Ignavibacteria bacterium]|nr:polyphosphate kinase 1 [Ignavibacteria bacterium]